MNGLQAALAAENLHDRVVVDEETGFRYVVVCANCDGRKCMACVFREQHDHCVDDCHDCCPRPNVHHSGPVSVYLARVGSEVTDDE